MEREEFAGFYAASFQRLVGQLANGGRTFLTLIDTGSYTCTSTAPNPPPRGTTVFGINRSPSR